MTALTYLLKRTIINYFKRLKEKPQKLIGPMCVLIWFMVMFIPNKGSKGISTPPYIFVSIFTLIILGIFLYAVYKGTKKVDSKFDMCDVNLVFTSPIKPQTVMIYGVIKQIAVELLTSFFIIYQIPNILKNLHVPAINQILLIVSFLIFQFVFCNLINLLIFALNTKFTALGNIIRRVIKSAILIFVAGTGLFFAQGDFLKSLEAMARHITYAAWIKYVPVLGWMREMALQTFTGIKITYFIFLILMLLLCAIILYITYEMKLDFYEDMLSSAENNELIKDVKSGKASAANNKQNFFTKAFRNVELKLNGVYGAKVLFYKHMNEYFKRSIFYFINTYSLILLVASIGLGLLTKNVDIKLILLVSCTLLFFSSGFGGKIYNEIYFHYIFLLPDTPQRKLFYGVLSSLVKVFTDSVILFVPFGLITRASILEILLSILCYVSLGGMLSYSGLFAFRIAQLFGFTGAIAQGLLFMFFQLFLMVPAVIIVAILTSGFSFMSGYALYPGLIIYSSIMAVLFSFGCVGILKDMEFRDRL